MLYQICRGDVSFGADIILHDINFEMKDHDKIAVVGRNGCGKTTLLRLISGELELSKRDSDSDKYIAKSGNPVIGYLKQIAFADESVTLKQELYKVFDPIITMKKKLDEMLAALGENPSEQQINAFTRFREEFEDKGGYYYEKEYHALVKNFGFLEEDLQKSLSEFSGGQRTKIAFIKLLLQKPDILLLDEPTNHLDMATVEWLEGYLRDYDKCVVIVSHDRMFLDRVVNVVYEIEYGTAKRYPGNYSAFEEQKRQNFLKQQKDYQMQQKEIERLTALVERFKNKPTKVSMARSKLKMIEHMDKIEAPVRYDTKSFHLNYQPRLQTGREVLNVRDLIIGYDRPLERLSYTHKRGIKVGIIGGNGLGKSTFLKTLIGQVPSLSGEFSFGYQVETGYFDQQMAQYESEKTVLEDYWDEFPTLLREEIRGDLGAFLFSGDDVFKAVNTLSGGEKSRLALAKIFKRKPNFLILDEPTNHMDLVGKETLEAMLKSFSGAVLIVSHDRYFLKQVADELLVFENDGVRWLPYGYEQYHEEQVEKNSGLRVLTAQDISIRNEKTERLLGSNEVASSGTSVEGANESGTGVDEIGETGAGGVGEAGAIVAGTGNDNQTGSLNPGKEAAKRERKIKKLEEKVAALENEIDELNAQLLLPEIATDYIKLEEIHSLIEEKENALMKAMEEWDQMS